jgi:hypothetical protein
MTQLQDCPLPSDRTQQVAALPAPRLVYRWIDVNVD